MKCAMAAMSYALTAMSALGKCKLFTLILRTTRYIPIKLVVCFVAERTFDREWGVRRIVQREGLLKW